MIYIKHCFWQNSTFLDEFMAMVLKATLIYPKSLSRFYINCSIIVWKKQIIIQQFRWHTLLLCVKNVADVQNVLSIPTFISFFNLDKTMEICQKQHLMYMVLKSIDIKFYTRCGKWSWQEPCIWEDLSISVVPYTYIVETSILHRWISLDCLCHLDPIKQKLHSQPLTQMSKFTMTKLESKGCKRTPGKRSYTNLTLLEGPLDTPS